MENNKPTGEDVGALLSGIHTHAELLLRWEKIKKSKKYLIYPDQIIYKEVDLLPILEALGLPKPIWNKTTSVKEYLKQRETIVSLNKPKVAAPVVQPLKVTFQESVLFPIIKFLLYAVAMILFCSGIAYWVHVFSN